MYVGKTAVKVPVCGSGVDHITWFIWKLALLYVCACVILFLLMLSIHTQQERSIANNLRSRLNALGLSDATHPTEPPPSVILIDETMMNTDSAGWHMYTQSGAIVTGTFHPYYANQHNCYRGRSRKTTNIQITHTLLHVTHIYTLTLPHMINALFFWINTVTVINWSTCLSVHPSDVPCIAVGWARPANFTGEFLRKPIRSKQLIDSLRRCFKAPPIGECIIDFVLTVLTHLFYLLRACFLLSPSHTSGWHHSIRHHARRIIHATKAQFLIFLLIFFLTLFILLTQRRPCWLFTNK